MKERKFDYVLIVQGNYGYGWGDLTQEGTWKEARAMRRCYDENETNAPHRVISRRVLRAAVK